MEAAMWHVIRMAGERKASLPIGKKYDRKVKNVFDSRTWESQEGI